ncbi:MAG: NAD(P)H-dependent glycerol-3-phosphate dehydrogenase [Candidatus Coatesbacteria bacterium]
MSATVAVVGAGGWGTAIARLLANQGHRVLLWVREPEIADAIERTRENVPFLSGVAIPAAVEVVRDLAAVTDGPRDAIVFAVPSSFLAATAGRLPEWAATGATLVSVAKGLDHGTGRRPTQILMAVLGAPADRVCALSGPSHAEEVGRDLPTAVVAASASPETAARIQRLFIGPRFRVYAQTDVAGVELGGALKNIIAVACGIADGLGLGDNTQAAMVTRGLAEVTRLGVAMGARRDTFMGLSGLGDMVVTCTSLHSRNRRVGRRLGKGERLEDVLGGMAQVAEGVEACRSAWRLARERGIRMPITEQTHRVLFEGVPAARALDELMNRGARSEEEPDGA